MDPQPTDQVAPIAPVETPKQKSKLPWILVGIGLLIAIGVVAFIKMFTMPYVQRPPFSATPTIEPDPTAIWHTYTNNYLNYSLKFPSDWEISSQHGEELETAPYITISSPCDYAAHERCKSFEVAPYGDSKPNTSFEEMIGIGTHIQENLIISKSYIKIDNERGLKVESHLGPQYIGHVNEPIIEAVTTHYGKIYYFSYGEQQDTGITTLESANLFDQILSTFKFTDNHESVVLTSPIANAAIVSPVTVSGTVPPGWMFEGQLPIKLLDNNRKLIAQGVGREVTPGSWQSSEPVKFTGTLTFTTTAKSGFLLIENDNPSGLPENSKSYEIPVNFK